MSSAVTKTIVEGVAWTTVGVTTAKVIAIVNVLLVLSSLSVYEYGVVELIISIPALFGIMSLPGLDVVVTTDTIYEKSKNNLQKVHYMLTSYFSLRLIMGIIATVGLFLSSSIIENYYNTDIGLMLKIISLTFLLGVFRSLFLIVFKAGLHFKLLSAYSFLDEFGKLGILATIIFFFELDPVMIILTYILTDLLSLICFAPAFFKYKKVLLGGAFGSGGWKNPLYMLKAHGKWSIFATYLGMFGQNIRPWIIKVFLGTEMVGLYGLALGMYQHTSSLLPISRVIGPLIPRYLHEKKKLYRLINSAIKYQFVSLVLSATAMAFFFPFLIDTFFPEYADSYPLYLLLLFAFIPASFSIIFEPVFHALKAQKNLFYIGVMRLLIIIFILPIVLYFFGMLGIAVEIVVTATVYTFERYRKLKKLLPEYSLSIRDIFNISAIDRMIMGKVSSAIKNISVVRLFTK